MEADFHGLYNAPENCQSLSTTKKSESLVLIPIMKVVFSVPPKMFTLSGNNTNYTTRNQTEYIFKEPLINYVIDLQQKMEDVILIDLNGNKIKIDGTVSRLTPVIVLVQALKYTPLFFKKL